jgi:SAM-dependent methyltransferase
MDQTPVHDQHNPDLLAFMPQGVDSVAEIGCSSGALAREYKKVNPRCHYIGIEIDANYARLAQRYCDAVHMLDIEAVDEAMLRERLLAQCYVFGDSLEHLRDPWAVLSRVRAVIPSDGTVVACIPNVQHWSVQVRLARGDFRYEDAGLLDRTHLRWFTRSTLVELFEGCGFEIEEGVPRIFPEPGREPYLKLIAEMAKAAGGDPYQALNDALPLQYVVRAVPV